MPIVVVPLCTMTWPPEYLVCVKLAMTSSRISHKSSEGYDSASSAGSAPMACRISSQNATKTGQSAWSWVPSCTHPLILTAFNARSSASILFDHPCVYMYVYGIWVSHGAWCARRRMIALAWRSEMHTPPTTTPDDHHSTPLTGS